MNLQQAKEQVPIRDVLAFNGIDVKNRNFKCVHVFHDDNNASAMVSKDGFGYFCNTCGYGGDSIALYERGMLGSVLTFPEAKRRFLSDFNIEVDDSFNYATPANYLTEIYNIITQKENLAKGTEYLEDRGLKNILNVGYMPLNLRLSTPQAREEYKLLRGRIVYPIRDHRGVLVGFSGRHIGKANKKIPKYLNTKSYDKKEILFGYSIAKRYTEKTGWMAFVEGYTDWNAAYQNKHLNFAAYCTAKISDEQAAIAKNDNFVKFAVLFTDGDEASEKVLKDNIEILFKNSGKYVKICKMPKGSDPCDYILENPHTNFLNKAEEVWKLFSYFEGFDLIKSLNTTYRKRALIKMAQSLDEDLSVLKSMWASHIKNRKR